MTSNDLERVKSGVDKPQPMDHNILHDKDPGEVEQIYNPGSMEEQGHVVQKKEDPALAESTLVEYIEGVGISGPGSLPTAHDDRAPDKEFQEMIARKGGYEDVVAQLQENLAKAKKQVKQLELAIETLQAGDSQTSKYADLTFWEAAQEYLREVDTPKTTRQIWDGISKQGIESSSRDPINTLGAVLVQQTKHFNRQGKLWRLTEWNNEPANHTEANGDPSNAS